MPLSKELKGIMKRRENASVFDTKKPAFEANTRDLMRRHKAAKSDMLIWRDLLNQAYHYAVPNYNPWENLDTGTEITPGENLAADIYDLTLPVAHQRLVNKMLVGMAPQGQQWVKFVPGDRFGPKDSAEYKVALEFTQKMTDQWFQILDRSNFYLAFGESLSDTLISTGVLAINEGTKSKPLRFEACPVTQVMFEGDAIGGFSAIFRDWNKVKVEFIKQLWPEARLPANKTKDQTVNIFECSYIDYDADPSEKYRYVIMTSSQDVLLQTSSPSWPWVPYRMRKLAGEVRGRGPSLEAWPTAATINEAVGDELMAAAFVANPMYMAASDSAFNEETFVAKPGAIIPVQMHMGNVPIQGFPPAGNINFTAMLVSDFRQQINDLLFSSPLGPINAPDRTATEAQLRYTENLESFMAMVPRLQTEFFDPMIARSMYIINKVLPETFADVPPEIRDKLLSVDGEILDLRYETPLMTARGNVKVAQLERWFTSLSSFVGPEGAAASLKSTKLPQMIAENVGADVSVIKGEEQLQADLDAAAEAMIKQQTGEDINVETNADGQVTGNEIEV